MGGLSSSSCPGASSGQTNGFGSSPPARPRRAVLRGLGLREGRNAMTSLGSFAPGTAVTPGVLGPPRDRTATSVERLTVRPPRPCPPAAFANDATANESQQATAQTVGERFSNTSLPLYIRFEDGGV